MATADKLVNYIAKISRKTYKKNIVTKSWGSQGLEKQIKKFNQELESKYTSGPSPYQFKTKVENE